MTEDPKPGDPNFLFMRNSILADLFEVSPRGEDDPEQELYDVLRCSAWHPDHPETTCWLKRLHPGAHIIMLGQRDFFSWGDDVESPEDGMEIL